MSREAALITGNSQDIYISQRSQYNPHMDKRTEQLRELMQEHGLNAPAVAKLIGRKANTIRIWRMENTTRPIPKDALELLQIKLADRGQHQKAA